jgi:hypothetical protein
VLNDYSVAVTKARTKFRLNRGNLKQITIWTVMVSILQEYSPYRFSVCERYIKRNHRVPFTSSKFMSFQCSSQNARKVVTEALIDGLGQSRMQSAYSTHAANRVGVWRGQGSH